MLNLQNLGAVSRVVSPARSPLAPAVAAVPDKTPTGQALTLLTEIAANEVDALDALLTEIGNDIRNNKHIRFDRLSTVHFMRWVIFRRNEHMKADYLMLECNHDGSAEDFVAELIAAGDSAVRRIYAKCVSYAAKVTATEAGDQPSALAGFLLSQRIPYAAFYAANGRSSVQQILAESMAYDAIQRFVDKQSRQLSPEALYRAVREHLNETGLLAKLGAKPSVEAERDSIPRLVWHLLPELIGPILLSPLLIPALLFKEATDPQDEIAPPTERQGTVARLAEQEDRKVQNQLSHIVPLKVGPFRRYVLKRVMTSIDLLARRYFNQGDLGGIVSIHFARWALIDDERVLVFFSNYDGSWENYLGDFIDIASVGLTSVWSNTLGFPRSLLLAFKGAKDEERFKSWTRAHQVYTQVWYSAYPTLTVKNIRQNHLVAEGLRVPLTEARAMADWLQLL